MLCVISHFVVRIQYPDGPDHTGIVTLVLEVAFFILNFFVSQRLSSLLLYGTVHILCDMLSLAEIYSPMYVFTKHNYKPKEMCNDKSVCLGPSQTLKSWFRPK